MRTSIPAGRFGVRAMFVLVLWLFGWAAVAAQPCCERLAAGIPHHSEAAFAAGHSDDHHHGSNSTQQDHHHCPQFKAADLVTPSLGIAKNPAHDSLAVYAALRSHADALRLIAHVCRAPLHLATPPPHLVTPFLSKRLRI